MSKEGMNEYEKKHIARLRKIAPECTVLLKKNGDFPLDTPEEIALYGGGARHIVKGGTGSGEVNSRYVPNVERVLTKAGFTITTKAWLDAYDAILVSAHKDFKKEIRRRAKENHTMAVLEGMGMVMPEPEYELPLIGEGNTAIYILSRISGEGNDRKAIKGDILLSETEKRDILNLQKKYKKFMLVLNVGGPIDISPVAEQVDNILLLSQLGAVTGKVLADLLLGKSYPSGKLATTWAMWEDYSKVGEFGNLDDTRYQEGIYVGYRYFDSIDKRALFPFGYGLGFTDFTITPLEVSGAKDLITLKVLVKNVGNYPGKEIVEVYVSAPQGKLDQPYQVLAGFAKTKELKPQEEAVVTVQFSLNDIASYDVERACYLLEMGNYILRVGDSSISTTIAAFLHVSEEIIVRQVKNCLGNVDFTDWNPDNAESRNQNTDKPFGVPILEIIPWDTKANTVKYNKTYTIDSKIKALTDEELVYMNIGSFHPKAGIMSVVGNASTLVAGAAGETTSVLKDKGIPVLVMADGPAGIRLSQQYAKDENGVYPVGETMPKSIAELLPTPVRWGMKLFKKNPPKGLQIHDQYATAIPIGTAIAQSWNLEVGTICGDIVGTEMELFGVHLWLAPALNIHRDIRCGRNFEYYSEDPLISGKIGAAVSNGVQNHSGCGVTIKHYAANNQEYNRYSNNSIVSERAMREIYLRGYEICVKESQPHAFMTSYNLLNGEHTSEHRGLLEDILRCEYGFKGIIMTDWIVSMTANKNSQHPLPNAWKIAAAGGDLVMPGSVGDYKNLILGLKEGKVSREQLEINATRVYRKIKELIN